MKLLCLLALAITSIPAFSQEPQKLDNAIEVHGVSFVQVKAALVDSGYFIDQSDPDVGTIITKEHSADDRRMFGSARDAYHIILYIRVKDSTATFQGKWNMNNAHRTAFNGSVVDKKDWNDLEYRNAGTNINHAVWPYMDKMAKTFGQPVIYKKL
jgi:hypothetical protein